MMRRLTAVLSLSLAGAFMLPGPAALQAQEEEEESPSYAYISGIEMAPAFREAYSTAVKKLAAAAGEIGIENQWHFWSTDAGYVLVFPVENMAYFDDQGAFWDQFDGTTAREDFFAALAEIPREASGSISVSVPDWGYAPEGGWGDINVAHVHNDWPKAGANDAYDELAKEFVAFLEEIEYPYAVQGHRSMFSDGRMTWVFFADNLSNYYSEDTWENLIEAAGAGDKWEAIQTTFTDVVKRWDHGDASYQKEMSYRGSEGSEE